MGRIQWQSDAGVKWIDGFCPLVNQQVNLYNVIHRKTMLIAKINHSHYYGMFVSDDHHHAEQSFVHSFAAHRADMEADGILLPAGNVLSIMLTRSPCGDRNHNGGCAQDLADFKAAHFNRAGDVIRIKIFEIYGGVRLHSSHEFADMVHLFRYRDETEWKHGFITRGSDRALRILAGSGIRLRAWDVREALDSNQWLQEEFSKYRLRKPLRLVSTDGYDQAGMFLKSDGLTVATSTSSQAMHLQNLPKKNWLTNLVLHVYGFRWGKWSSEGGTVG